LVIRSRKALEVRQVLIRCALGRSSLRPKASRSDLFERCSPITILICWDNNIIENARNRAAWRGYFDRAASDRRLQLAQSPCNLIDPALPDRREQEPAEIETRGFGDRDANGCFRCLPSRAHDNRFVSFSAVGEDDGEVRADSQAATPSTKK